MLRKLRLAEGVSRSVVRGAGSNIGSFPKYQGVTVCRRASSPSCLYVLLLVDEQASPATAADGDNDDNGDQV